MARNAWIGGVLFLLMMACLPERREEPLVLPGLAPFLQQDAATCQKLADEMSLEQKLGQMIVLERQGEPGPEDWLWMRAGKASGFQLTGIPAGRYLALQEELRSASPLPLLSMASRQRLFHNQFSEKPSFPPPVALLALPSDSLRQQFSAAYFQQGAALEVNGLSYPWLNPKQEEATALGVNEEMLRGIAWLNENHLLSFADAFTAPGVLQPARSSSRDSLLEAYRQLIRAGVSGFHIGPSLFEDNKRKTAGIGRFFRQELQFDGLLVARLEKLAQLNEIVESGADLILVPSEAAYVMDYLKAAYRRGVLSEQELDQKVRRILLAKAWSNHPKEGKAASAAPPARSLPASLNLPEEGADSSAAGPLPRPAQLSQYFSDRHWQYWQRRLYEESLVLASDEQKLLPLQARKQPYGVYHFGATGPEAPFDASFAKYSRLTSRYFQHWPALADSLRIHGEKGPAILVLHDFLLDSLQAATLLELAARQPLLLANMGRPENLAFFDHRLTVVQAFSDDALAQQLLGQLLFGGIPAQGQLPFTMNSYYRAGQGIRLPKERLSFSIPEQAGITPEKLVGIDAIVETAIDEEAFPGCQVLVAKDGAIIYDKSFGYHDYSRRRAVSTNDLYDLASITKAAATALAAMKLYEEEKISLNGRLRHQLEETRRTKLRNLSPRKLLAHQSGLQAHLPVVPYLLARGEHNNNCNLYFCDSPTDTFSIRVARDFYFNRLQEEAIVKGLLNLRARPYAGYRYSDANFVLLQRLLEAKGGAPLDSLVEEAFYGPLGLYRIGFNPIGAFSADAIVPTEDDQKWRHQLLQGYVHDETAALLGGVAGHAGLFASAENLAVAFQMLLNGGTYGGREFLQPETIRYFTSARHGNHRGLGFDKPRKESAERGLFPERASDATFGHTGFTGTCVWADPEEGLVYIFLSNRIHPSVHNKKIFQKRVRERIHEVIYDALDTYAPEMPAL